MESLNDIARYLPIFTTFISAYFGTVILGRWRAKPQARHLLWWGIGVYVYGVGTLVESMTTLMGWNVFLFKSWYISGALLGGAPLALGTVYLLIGKRAGHVGAILLLITVAVTSFFVIGSPIDYTKVEPHILSSEVLQWQQIRLVSPFINGLAAIFLIGGAVYSAGFYMRHPEGRNRFIGNVLIAIGATLPGIGGMGSRMGMTELLYIGELVGIIFIWYGYRECQKTPMPAATAAATT